MSKIYLLVGVLVITITIGANVLATMYGSPQHIWLFCNMLEWCAPEHPPYCPPDPKECG